MIRGLARVALISVAVWLQSGWASAQATASRSLAVLRETAFGPERATRIDCARWLSELGDPTYAPLLGRMLTDPDAEVRAAVQIGLAMLRSPGRIDLRDVQRLPADVQVWMIEQSVANDLLDTPQLAQINSNEIEGISPATRAVVLRSLGANGSSSEVHPDWRSMLELPDAWRGLRIEAALRLAGDEPEPGTEAAKLIDSVLDDAIENDGADDPGAVIRALDVTPPTPAAAAFAKRVLENAAGPDLRIAAIDTLLRHDAGQQGLRDDWAAVCEDLGRTGEPVAAMLMLRAARAAALNDRPIPAWLAGPTFVNDANGSLALAGRIVTAEGSHTEAAAMLLRGAGEYLAPALLDWAETQPVRVAGPVARAVLVSGAWRSPLNPVQLRAAAIVLRATPEDWPTRDRPWPASAELSLIAQAMRSGRGAMAHRLAEVPGADDPSSWASVLGLAGLLAAETERSEAAVGVLDGAMPGRARTLLTIAECPMMPAAWRAQAAWLAAVRSDEVPELLAAMTWADEAAEPAVSSVPGHRADMLGQ